MTESIKPRKGRIVIERDENGEWPAWVYEGAQTANDEGDDETAKDPNTIGAWATWILDALEAAQREG